MLKINYRKSCFNLFRRAYFLQKNNCLHMLVARACGGWGEGDGKVIQIWSIQHQNIYF